jgi:hypothetical protein
VDIGSIKELNWCKFGVEQLKKFGSAYGRKNSFPGCLFYLVVTTLFYLFEKKLEPLYSLFLFSDFLFGHFAADSVP